MKNIVKKCLPVVALLSLPFLAGCPVLDDPETPGTLVVRQLHLSERWAGDTGRVMIIDIDPEQTVEVSVYDPSGTFSLPATFGVDTGAVRVSAKGNNVFGITGLLPGGMAVVRFDAIGDSAELRVFVRNWRLDQAHRFLLAPDPINFPFCPDTPYDSDFYGGLPREVRNVPFQNRGVELPFRANRWATYRLITERGWHYESPSGFSHSSDGVHRGALRETAFRQAYDVPHIMQEYCPLLQKYVFRFSLYERSGDLIGFDDRQRLELKTMHNVNFDCRNMRAYGHGETFTFRWKFKLPRNFTVSTEFSHLFQLKNEGGDGGNPIFTLTGRRRNDTNRDVMQLIYRGPTRSTTAGVLGDKEIPSANWIAAEVPLDLFRGEWVRAEAVVTYDNPGSFRIRLVRIRDMRVIMEFAFCPIHYASLNLPDPFMTYRPGNSYARPKFGIYRRIVHMNPFGVPDMHITPDGTPCFERSNFVRVFLRENWTTSVWFADIEMDRLRRDDGIVCYLRTEPGGPLTRYACLPCRPVER